MKILLSTGIICDDIIFRILGNLKTILKISNKFFKNLQFLKINLTEIIINFKKFTNILRF